MATTEDFQHLLKARHREELIVMPKKAPGLAITSMSSFCLGIGFAAGCFVSGSSYGMWGAGLGAAIALFIGRRNNRLENRLLEKYQDTAQRKD